MSAIAVIPARGGSKRIPHKNVIDFCGRPMIAWTIQAALESSLFDRVLVSTEDPEIAAISREWGAECPFLREGCHDDHSGVSEATIHALGQAREYYGEGHEIVVQLMANCPLRQAEDIVSHLEVFRGQRRTFQISCFPFGWMNPWWALTLDAEGRGQRSQDLPPLYCPTGAIWIARIDALLEQGSFYGEPLRYEPLDWMRAVDIDTRDDLRMARCLRQLLEEA